jgi:hypothetical protein
VQIHERSTQDDWPFTSAADWPDWGSAAGGSNRYHFPIRNRAGCLLSYRLAFIPLISFKRIWNQIDINCHVVYPPLPPPYHLHGCVVCIIRFHSAVHHPAQCPCLLYKPLKPTPSLYTHRRILCRFRTIRSAGLTTAARPYQDGGSKKDAEYSKAASFPKPGDTSSPTSVAVRVPTLSPGRWMAVGY